MTPERLQDLLTELRNCVSCGKCLPECPVYQWTGREEYTARGKVNSLRWLLWPDGGADESAAALIFRCNLCLRCQEACPAHLGLAEIFSAARQAFGGRLPVRAHRPEIISQPAFRRVAEQALRAGRRGSGRPASPARSRGTQRPTADERRPEQSGTGVVLVSPLMRVHAPGAVTALASRTDPHPLRTPAGASLFALYWQGMPDRQLTERERIEARWGGTGWAGFVEPELETLREEDTPIPAEGIRIDPAAVNRLRAEWANRSGRNFVVLPPPLSLTVDQLDEWNAAWRPLADIGCREVPDTWLALRGEGVAWVDPALAHHLGAALLDRARERGLTDIVVTSVRSWLWLRRLAGLGTGIRIHFPAVLWPLNDRFITSADASTGDSGK